MEKKIYVNSTHNEKCQQVFVESKDSVSLIRNFFSDAKDTSFEEIVEAENKFRTDNDSLIRFIFNDQEREKVIQGLQSCEDTGQVATFAKTLYNEEILSLEILRSADFHRTILPLLKFKPTEDAIKQAISKQVK